MNMRECSTCWRWWDDFDKTGVCPHGHENHWDDSDLDHDEHLRKMTW